MQKNCETQPQSNRKRATATENQAPRQKQKKTAIFVKEAKIQNAVPAISIFASYLHGVQSLIG